MKRCLGFCMGCLFGAVVMSLAFWSSWTKLQAQGKESALQSADRVLQDRYVARVLDFAHLALMLRGIEPNLEREWIEESLAIHARELEQDFRQSRIAGHAMKMITGYYTKHNLPVPPELEQIWQSLTEDPELAMSHSGYSFNAAFDERLQEFDALMQSRRAGNDFHSQDNLPAGRPANSIERTRAWGSAVSF